MIVRNNLLSNEIRKGNFLYEYSLRPQKPKLGKAFPKGIVEINLCLKFEESQSKIATDRVQIHIDPIYV